MSDLISREGARKAYINFTIDYLEGKHNKSFHEILNDLPDAQPERKKGKWTDLNFKDEAWGEAFECSICGEMAIGKANYCYNCGADMRGC